MNDWRGQTCVIIASGPSLTVEDCERVREWREAGGGRCIAINTSYQRALWADALYACDLQWWAGNVTAVKKDFPGQMWTQDVKAAKGYGLQLIRSAPGETLSRNPGLIHQGFNSGFQAINLAYHWGVRSFVLLGYDMHEDGKRTHWHAPYARAVHTPFRKCLAAFATLAVDLKAEGVTVVNCTRRTALKVWPAGDLAATIPVPVCEAAD